MREHYPTHTHPSHANTHTHTRTNTHTHTHTHTHTNNHLQVTAHLHLHQQTYLVLLVWFTIPLCSTRINNQVTPLSHVATMDLIPSSWHQQLKQNMFALNDKTHRCVVVAASFSKQRTTRGKDMKEMVATPITSGLLYYYTYTAQIHRLS